MNSEDIEVLEVEVEEQGDRSIKSDANLKQTRENIGKVADRHFSCPMPSLIKENVHRENST